MTVPSPHSVWDGIDSEGMEYHELESELVGQWRWGTIHETIYSRPVDETYWKMRYKIQNDEGIVWDSAVVVQVTPVEETVVVRKWKPVTENSNA